MAQINDIEISKLRDELDALDTAIIMAFEKRMTCVQKIGNIKAEKNLPIYDKKREEEILEKRLKLVKNQEFSSSVKKLLTFMMDISKTEQRKKTVDTIVAYQGVEGSYSHEATKNYFNDVYKGIPLPNFGDVFKEIIEGRAEYGVLPLENSSTGSITEVYDLLIKFGCYIVGESIIEVDHCLLGTQDSTIEDIQIVYSHEQGFMQCKNYLDAHPKWECKSYYNTAISAKHVAETGSIHLAAIASRTAANTYGLKILADNIRNQQSNYTRFIIVSQKASIELNNNKASVCFVVKHESGSLLNILSIFAKYKLNMMKLESRPIAGEPWKYRFYMDFEIPKNVVIEDLMSGGLMTDIGSNTTEWRFLGSYNAADRDI